MGKLRTKQQGVRKGMHFRKVNSWVEVGRKPHDLAGKGHAFMACVKVGYGNVRRGKPSNLGVCVSGKNPRKAIAAALRKAAGQIGGRSGAFAGLGRR
jgi:hypothetical protein